jgi:RHS repeat-associated protein
LLSVREPSRPLRKLTELSVPASAFYERPRYQRWHWHGTLLEDKRNETGTYYRLNRTYDPSTGRFTQEDPIGLAGGLNVYGFAAGDPVSYSDPYGLNPCENMGYFLQSTCERAVESALGTVEGVLNAVRSVSDFAGITGVGEAATGLSASDPRRELSAGQRLGALAGAAGSVAPVGRGLRGATTGLRGVFRSGGGLADNTVVGIRSLLRDNGFIMTLARNRRGYLFTNSAGEEVRIMRGAQGWYLRVQNAGG